VLSFVKGSMVAQMMVLGFCLSFLSSDFVWFFQRLLYYALGDTKV